jgi:hypothetical protein
LLHRKAERLTESLTDTSQLAGSGRSRIVGCCNRLERATWASPMLPRVSLLRAYINSCPATSAHNLKTNLGFASCYLCRHHSLPHPERQCAPANKRAGLQNHSSLQSCKREGELGFWEALCATARVLHYYRSSSIQSDGAAHRRLYRRLLRSVFSNVVINNVTVATTSASERYVRRAPVWLFIMFCEYIFSCCLFLFILLFSIFSIFELYMVVAGIVIFNIIKLIIKIMPNYPTWCRFILPDWN